MDDENQGLYRSQISRLIDLLACGDLDPPETERIAKICVQAQSDPAATLLKHYGADAAKVAEYDADGVAAFIIFIELEDYFAVADTVDELYEQIIDAFERPALPAYPYDDNDFETVSDFYRWVDSQLLVHHPKYQLIGFGESYSHDFQVILVRRDDVEEILNLCAALGVLAGRCA